MQMRRQVLNLKLALEIRLEPHKRAQEGGHWGGPKIRPQNTP